MCTIFLLANYFYWKDVWRRKKNLIESMPFQCCADVKVTHVFVLVFGNNSSGGLTFLTDFHGKITTEQKNMNTGVNEDLNLNLYANQY